MCWNKQKYILTHDSLQFPFEVKHEYLKRVKQYESFSVSLPVSIKNLPKHNILSTWYSKRNKK